jgi:CCR4-NOT transcription complex subunit 4
MSDGVISSLTEFIQLIPTLRSNEYFGQYGKISKIVIVKRTSTSRKNPVIGLYVTYHRKEDAARCISAVDGTSQSAGGGDVMRASYGTTKYCMTFLRGQACSDHGCMNLHDWGDEKDCFTKEDLTTLYVFKRDFPFRHLIILQETYPQRYRG